MNHLYKKYVLSTGVNTDTRTIIENQIYFALKGPSFNGNHYAKQALDSGALHVVLDEDSSEIPDSRKTIVDDVLTTLQELAHYHRKQLKETTFIGITGSNGKTTHKELLHACLSKKYKTKATKGNLNNHIGVPLTLLSIKPDTEFAIIEMGANHVNEIAFLSSIAEPDFGLITNIGKAHIEGFGSLENIHLGKTELYRNIEKSNGLLFIDYANESLHKYLPKDTKKVWYGNGPKSIVSATVKGNFPTLSFELKIGQEKLSINSNLYGSFNLQNFIAAAAIAHYFKVSCAEIKTAFEDYTPSNKRSQIEKTNRNTLIVDAYNANYSSMKLALEDFKNYPSDNKLAILGAMKEQGDDTHTVHKEIIDLCKNLGIETYFIGDEYKAVEPENNSVFTDKNQLVEVLKKLKNFTVLLKGSRGAKLEELIPLF